MHAAARVERFFEFPEAKNSKIEEREAEKKVESPLAFICIFLLVFSLFALVNLSLRAAITRDNIKIEKLKSTLEREKEINQDLNLKKLALSNPSYVEKIAREKLGMIPPTTVNYLSISSEEELEAQKKVAYKEEKTIEKSSLRQGKRSTFVLPMLVNYLF